MRVWHEAAVRLRDSPREAMLLGAARVIPQAVWLCLGMWMQHVLGERGLLRQADFAGKAGAWDLFLAGTVLAALAGLTPLRLQTDWQLGRISGVLDKNDLGFLAQSKARWLWGRAIAVRFCAGCVMIAAVLPCCIAAAAAKTVWLLLPADGEELLPLTAVLHLILLAGISLLLPLRVYAARTVLPFCFLKQPHASPVRILRLAFVLTRRQTLRILAQRICSLPLLVMPFAGLYAVSVLYCAEQVRAARCWRHMQPRRRTGFAQMELHAEGT